MNNDKRIFAIVSLGLLLAGCLVPFTIAAAGRGDLAVGFGVVAGLLALLFGALSWSDRVGRTVTVTLLPLLVFGGAGLAVIHRIRTQPRVAESQQLLSARARLAELRLTFTDQSSFVKKVTQEVQELEKREHAR